MIMNKRYEHEGLPLNEPIIRDILTNQQPPPQELLSINDLEERVKRFHLRHGGESPSIVNCYSAVRAVLEELREAGGVEKVREPNGRVFFRSLNDNSDPIESRRTSMIKNFVDIIVTPEDEDTLWRYMSFEQFVNILETNSLFFAKAGKFKDPYEGFMPQRILSNFKQHLLNNGLAETFVERMMKENEVYRKYIMCSCWHQNVVESMAMWDKYHLRNSGIAIKTTVGKMNNSLSDKCVVYIGKIVYIDNDTDNALYLKTLLDSNTKTRLSEILLYSPYFRKRKEYEHEQEVRLIVDIVSVDIVSVDDTLETFLKNELPDMCDTGIPVDTDVGTLIDEVIISPYAESWVTKTLQSVVAKYGFNFQVNPSTLLDIPI